MPVVGGSGAEAYERLKEQMVDSIIEHRLFREQQLEEFFSRVEEENVHLDRERVRGICALVKADLNS